MDGIQQCVVVEVHGGLGHDQTGAALQDVIRAC